MASTHTTRRGLLGAMAAIPAVAIPAMPALASNTAHFDMVMRRFWGATHAYNDAPGSISYEEEEVLSEAYSEAHDAMWAERPLTADQFVRKFIAMFADGGMPLYSTIEELVLDAQHIAGGRR